MAQAELYVVATPLGNRMDITLRAIECLKSVPVIFAEDTREILKLLELCGIPAAGKKVFSYASHNLKKATALALEILGEGRSVALVTDRGTPGISDPGALLVQQAHEQGIKVVPVPGPSAVAALVSISGYSGGFLFKGFLPRENKARSELWDQVATMGWPICFYESPRRVRATFDEIRERFQSGRLFFGREMTKVFEQCSWLDLKTATAEDLPEQGEYALLFFPPPLEVNESWEQEVSWRLESDRDWSKRVAAKYGVASKDVYNAVQRAKKSLTP